MLSVIRLPGTCRNLYDPLYCTNRTPHIQIQASSLQEYLFATKLRLSGGNAQVRRLRRAACLFLTGLKAPVAQTVTEWSQSSFISNEHCTAVFSSVHFLEFPRGSLEA